MIQKSRNSILSRLSHLNTVLFVYYDLPLYRHPMHILSASMFWQVVFLVTEEINLMQMREWTGSVLAMML